MVFVKFDADYISLDELAEIVAVPVNQIEGLFDRNMLNEEGDSELEDGLLGKIKAAYKLLHMSITPEDAQQIIRDVNFYNDEGNPVEAELKRVAQEYSKS
jgi:hypothetical protein